ncbi:MAG TPA: histidinol dehydrogenase, partial [Lacunisphaera sp.]|nr:histidinol dehydrogenase [Lacunisphaera sp.]
MKPLTWKNLSAPARRAALQRPAQKAQKRTAVIVAGILALVRRQGDRALRQLTARLDGAKLSSLRVSPAEFAAAEKALA